MNKKIETIKDAAEWGERYLAHLANRNERLDMSDEQEYEREYQRLCDELKPVLTDEFLDGLMKAARTCGWSADYTEIDQFVRWCFDIVGKKAPDLEPYQNP